MNIGPKQNIPRQPLQSMHGECVQGSLVERRKMLAKAAFHLGAARSLKGVRRIGDTHFKTI
jgi:hypothetical protein